MMINSFLEKFIMKKSMTVFFTGCCMLFSSSMYSSHFYSNQNKKFFELMVKLNAFENEVQSVLKICKNNPPCLISLNDFNSFCQYSVYIDYTLKKIINDPNLTEYLLEKPSFDKEIISYSDTIYKLYTLLKNPNQWFKPFVNKNGKMFSSSNIFQFDAKLKTNKREAMQRYLARSHLNISILLAKKTRLNINKLDKRKVVFFELFPSLSPKQKREMEDFFDQERGFLEKLLIKQDVAITTGKNVVEILTQINKNNKNKTAS